jgi:hypothetical protein
MVRIADGTGIPLDGIVGALSGDVRSDLGLDSYASRRIAGGAVADALAPVIRGTVRTALRIAGRFRRS